MDGSVFVFSNRRRNMAKIFFYDAPGGGTWICAKRLEQSTFRWPEAGEKTVEMTPAELQLLLSGIDLSRTRLRPWWRRDAVPATTAEPPAAQLLAPAWPLPGPVSTDRGAVRPPGPSDN